MTLGNILTIQVQSGVIVATAYLDDKKWYRAKVVEVIRDDYDENQSQVQLSFVSDQNKDIFAWGTA